VKRFLKFSPYLILLGGFALRLYRLGANSLWYDETVSLLLAQSELAELIRHTAGDIHPPLYYLLLHFWGRVAGWSEFAMAFVSLWFGVLLIALVCRIAREWFTIKSVGIVAALFVTLSPYNVWYSQEVRMYTLGAVLGLLSVYFLRRMLAQPKIFSRAFFAYVIFTVLGFYTLYYFIFLMVFQWVWAVYRLSRLANRSTLHTSLSSLLVPLAAFLASQLALILLYLPWLLIALRQAISPPVPPWREFIALPRVILETFSALAFGQAVDPNVFGFIALLFFIPVCASLWREWRTARAVTPSALENTSYADDDLRSAMRNPRVAALENASYASQNLSTLPASRSTVSIWFLLGYFLIPLAAIYVLSFWKPLYHVRYIFTYSPAFYILAAYVVIKLGNELARAQQTNSARRVQGLRALAAMVSIGYLIVTGYSLYNFWHNEQYAEDDLRGAVNFIAERWRPGDVILVNAGYAYPAFAYYYPDPIARRVRLPFYTPLSGGVSALATASKRPLLLMTGSIGGAKNLGWGDARSDFFAATAEETRLALDGVLEAHQRVWMLRLYDTVVDPDGVTRSYLEEHAHLFEDQGFTGESQLRVQGFITESNPSLPVTANFALKMIGEQVQLVGYETGARNLRAGDVFDTVLYWRLLQSVNHNYRLSLQFLDAHGQNVAQTDELPLSEMLPMTRWRVGELYREPLRVKIPPQIAPGEYRAIVKLYEPRSGVVLGEVIELGKIQVR